MAHNIRKRSSHSALTGPRVRYQTVCAPNRASGIVQIWYCSNRSIGTIYVVVPVYLVVVVVVVVVAVVVVVVVFFSFLPCRRFQSSSNSWIGSMAK